MHSNEYSVNMVIAILGYKDLSRLFRVTLNIDTATAIVSTAKVDKKLLNY